MDKANCIISLMVPTRRPSQLYPLLDSIEKNTNHKNLIEVIIKLDDDQKEFYTELESKIKNYSFEIKILISARLFGYFSMWIFKQIYWKMSNKDAYFLAMFTDEARFEDGWDDVIRKYYKFYNDDVFRLRLSHFKYFNYSNIGQSNIFPDSFPIFTRKWLEITNGFGDFWGSDVFHQCVSYHLSRGTAAFYTTFTKNNILRDVVINENIVTNISIFGDDIEEEESKAKTLLIHDEWLRMMSRKSQILQCYYARIMLLTIFAERDKIKDYKILDNKSSKELLLENTHGEILYKFSYDVPKWYAYLNQLEFFILRNIAYYRLFNPKIGNILSSVSIHPIRNLKGLFFRIYSKIKTCLYKYAENKPIILKPLRYLNKKLEIIINKPNSVSIINIVPVKTNHKYIITADNGFMYIKNNGHIEPSDYLYKVLSKSKYTQCSREIFIENFNHAFDVENGKFVEDIY